MRYIYNFLFYLALPFILLRLWLKSYRSPFYRERFAERLGFYPDGLKGVIWVHAVSVGEAVAAVPLIEAIEAAYPNIPLLVTTMTPTGAARVKAAFGNRVKHFYIPYDFSFAVNRFLNKIKPEIGIIMETELWPNLIFACKARSIPLLLMNARLSQQSAKGYGYIQPLTRQMIKALTLIGVQGASDQARFRVLGARESQVVITGNIKFDLKLPANLTQKVHEIKNTIGHHRRIWIAASTHEGEEEILFNAQRRIQAQCPDALLVLVPRHPERFNSVAKRMTSQKFVIVRRSEGTTCSASTDIYLCDTMGEALFMYAATDVAFVGGSLIPIGGHNMLEPAALGKPILTGPHLFNFAEISEALMAKGVLTVVKDAQSLALSVIMLFKNPDRCSLRGAQAKAFVDANKGIVSKQLSLIQASMHKL